MRRAAAGGARGHGRAVLAVAGVFTGAGLTFASAVSRMPEIKSQVDASATELAFALVCVGIGSIVAMPFAGRMVQRFGTAAVCRVFATIALVGWSLVPIATSVPALAGILLLTGVGVGTWDVSMNVQGSIVEHRRRQVLMPLWHGLFSVGAVGGAVAGAAAARYDVPLAWQFPVVSTLLWFVVLICCAAFLDGTPADGGSGGNGVATATSNDDEAPGRRVPGDDEAPAAHRATGSTVGRAPPMGPPAPGSGAGRRRGITRIEVLLGLITLGTAVGEGAANDWLAVALVDGRGAPAAIGALTYAGFNVTMALGRFTGGPLIARFGRVRALRAASLIAACGIVLLCLVPGTTTALIGAAAWGLGLAIVFPSAMSAAGEVPGRGARAIANVATIGYGGFLLGAPMIGLLAHFMPLLHALLAVAAVVLIIAILAPAARERRAPARTIARS